MPNRLAESSSPYLLQHQNNPVDWYPWCDEAFEKARAEDKPIFLSVGYSACHWCHVMEHESFENDGIAKILNEHFIAIKVDREERPDVDQIYMQAVQMLTGSGGWPMSVFMTADAKPFFGGTYWPPDSRWGRPGFGQVLLAIVDAWQNKRQDIDHQGETLTEHLQNAARGPSSEAQDLDPQWIAAADRWLLAQHDAQHGGFGQAPKFPHAMDLSLWIELTALDGDPARTQAIHTTLGQMARGGIYDHLGGGFARYSVDAEWLVPHFEKMLYDNALLTVVYADAYRLFGIDEYRGVVVETLDYVLRDMTNEHGGFSSTEDADSEGVEGKFYVWQPDEVISVLGENLGELFCECYDITPAGNFEGNSIPRLKTPIEQFALQRELDATTVEQQMADARQRLWQHRESRIRPGLDDKVLLSWNGLMIRALVHAYRAVADQRYLASANRAVEFISNHMRKTDGRFWHTWRNGTPSLDAYLDDYAYVLEGLVALFQVDSRPKTLQLALDIAQILLDEYADEDGAFFFTSIHHESLIARTKDMADQSVPSGNAVAASALLTLGRLTGREELTAAGNRCLLAQGGVMQKSPQACGYALNTLLRLQQPEREAVLIVDLDKQDHHSLLAGFLRALHPNTLSLVGDGTFDDRLVSLCPLCEGKEMQVIEDTTLATLFKCENHSCQPPIYGDRLQAEILTIPGADSHE